MTQDNRPLTSHERTLARWMLEHAKPEASAFLVQLERAEVTPWVCECGCASINFQIRGHPEATSGSLLVIADFLFNAGADVCGIFLFEKEGLLSGLEVYGLSGDVPKTLPDPATLRPFTDGSVSP